LCGAWYLLQDEALGSHVGYSERHWNKKIERDNETVEVDCYEAAYTNIITIIIIIIMFQV
jgi:hypothetical protein